MPPLAIGDDAGFAGAALGDDFGFTGASAELGFGGAAASPTGLPGTGAG
jgi:hypothetical protein